MVKMGKEKVGEQNRGPGGRKPLLILSGYEILGAFYSEKLPGPGKSGRIIVLNTNLYYTSNMQTADMADPGDQFQWLEAVLTNASLAGEMVRASASSNSCWWSSSDVLCSTHIVPSFLSMISFNFQNSFMK